MKITILIIIKYVKISNETNETRTTVFNRVLKLYIIKLMNKIERWTKFNKTCTFTHILLLRKNTCTSITVYDTTHSHIIMLNNFIDLHYTRLSIVI